MDVWIGSASRAFMSGLALSGSDRAYVKYATWYVGAIRSALKGRTLIAVNAGEVPVSKRGAARMVSLAMLILIARMRGGTGVWLGAGVPVPKTLAYLAPTYKWVARLCGHSGFRDKESLPIVGSARSMPDWAFDLGAPISEWTPSRQRRHLGVVMRGDRPYPDAEWLEWVRRTAACLALDIVVVVQVQRDTTMATRLAADLGGSVAQFDFGAHSSVEAEVRRVYADCSIVIGDRLHGLIVAATEGAVPLGWVPSSNGKIARHFDVVGLRWVGRWEGRRVDEYGPITRAELNDFSGALEKSIDAARSAIDAVSVELEEFAIPSAVTR
ncbi:polysaccharide pyruvyl transferase family protein [Rhodococcus pyridinivorans]|uniref:polysaccharide pyruvyl transferase family protein n=1 Tax=Rhodococcus pyridinivorans TaxID=103816 RepID=UPI001E451364|nr:polysaccharide pyruvyl transferase family protein [Rhodococcus pyridinivorans]UGQ59055.1 polysaccharide pyruvyl transferase family protein [Rhodococcus pyridinivorans]